VALPGKNPSDAHADEAKFLTVSMPTFRDNKQALHSTFQDVLTTTNPLQSSITNYKRKISQKC